MMQKELLEQLEERRKLHAALLQSLDDPAMTIQKFNQSEQGGLPPVMPRPSIASQPPQAPPAVAAAAAAPSAPAPAQQQPAAKHPPSVRPPIAIPKPSPASLSPSPKLSEAAPAPPLKVAPSSPAPQQRNHPPPVAAPPVAKAATPRASSSPAPPLPKPLAAPAAAAKAAMVPPPKLVPQVPKLPGRTAPAVPAPPPAAAPALGKTPSVRSPPVSIPKAAPPLPPPAVRKPPMQQPEAVTKQAVLPPLESSLSPKVAEPEAEVEAADPPQKEKKEPLAGPNVMNVVVVASECAPWSKTGGLGDVVGSLPKALARRGHRVMVVVPRYSNYDEAWDTTVRKRYNVAGQDVEVGFYHTYLNGVDWVFVDTSIFHSCARNIYGGSRLEVQFRMILLCKAAVEAPWHVPCGGIVYGDANLVFIANDWHTALLPVYLQAYYRDHGLMNFARCVLVIHNMAHQGRGPVAEFPRLGLPGHYLDKFKLYDPVGGEHMNIFMAGLITAHRLVAVSHGYAWECQTQLGGWGLDAVLRDHNWKLRGIVNGIDIQEWNPATDAFLKDDGYVNYSLETLEDKSKCKEALQKELGLPVKQDTPLIGFIGRLDHQKGVDIIGEAMPWMMQQELQLVMLGTGREDLEGMLRSAEANHKNKVRGWVGFSVKMAHRITAGADILLMPSRFEPCGLNQLYAMRYGTVPVVHAVGGLRDTVHAFDPFNSAGLGWTFDRAEAGGLIHALGNAMWTYWDFKDSWQALQRRGMTQDLSWDNAAQQYEEVMMAAKYQW